MKLEDFLESTLLQPVATKKEVEELCREAVKYNFKGVCLNPYYIPLARDFLIGGKTKLVSVVGFPLGCTCAILKGEEAKKAVLDGADEVDMVINIGALKDREEEALREDINRVVSCGVPVKVIIETGLLGRDEMAYACRLLSENGAKFVKTSTGFGPRGASVEDILMLRSLLPQGVGIKAAGGIRGADFAKQLIKAGADRIGTSSAAQIMESYRQQ